MDSPQATYQDLSIRFMTSMDKKKGFSQHSSNDDLLAKLNVTNNYQWLQMIIMLNFIKYHTKKFTLNIL